MQNPDEMTPIELARKVVDNMYENDFFSQWLGIKRKLVEPGYVVLTMEVRNDMLNGFGIMHGGISYSLADSCLAFAANSYGRISVTLDALMHYPASAVEGDILTAEARQINMTRRTAIFDITVKNQNDIVIGTYRGTVFRTDREFFPNIEKEEE